MLKLVRLLGLFQTMRGIQLLFFIFGVDAQNLETRSHYDGSTMASIQLSLEARLSSTAQLVIETQSQFELGQLTWNDSMTFDSDDVRRMRAYFFSQMKGTTKSNEGTVWLGAAFEVDATSIWIYGANLTAYNRPRRYEGEFTSPGIYEESIGGEKSNCSSAGGGAPEEYCLRDWYIDKSSDPIFPMIDLGSSSPYDPRTRPFYVSAMTNQRTGWDSEILTWYGMACVTVTELIYTEPHIPDATSTSTARTAIGVINTAVTLTQLEAQLQELTPENAVSYIMDSATSQLIVSNLPGISGYWDPDDPNWTYTQYKATESNNSLVRESSTLLGGRVPSTNQLLWNGYWLSVVEFTEVGGRKFPSPWLVVLLQQTCNQEGEFFKERNGHYSLDQITEANSLGDCAPCPSNKKCNGDGKLPYPKEGFWSPLADVSDYAMPCFSEDNCPGGEGIVCFESKEALDHCLQELLPVDSPVSSIFDKASDHRSFGSKFVCGEGSFGRLCDICETDYFYSTSSGCLSCKGSGTISGSVIMILILLATALFIAFLLKCSTVAGAMLCCYDSSGRPIKITDTILWRVVTDMPRIKIILATAQIVSTVTWATKVEWPEPFATLSSIFSISQLNLVEVVPAECLAKISFYQQVFAATLIPIGVAVLVHVASSSFIGIQVRVSRGTAIYLNQLIFFCVLPSTSLVLFRVFRCETFPDGSSWLSADLRYSCDSETYSAMIAYTAVMLLVYPIGIPCYFYAILRPKRHSIMSLDRKKPVPLKLRKYEFLFSDYASEYWHGETYRSIMRVFLSGLVVVFHDSAVICAFWGVLLSYGFVETTRVYQPFLHATNNAIATAAQYQIFFTYFCAFILVAEPFTQAGTALSCILLAANLIIFVVSFRRAKAEIRTRREIRRMQQKTADLAEQLEDFRGTVIGIVAVERGIGKDRKRFLPGGDWCATASKRDVLAAAKDIELDLVGVEQKEDELRRFLEVAANQMAKQEKALWYWREDEGRMDAHNSDSTFGDCWVQYADSVAAQMEFFWTKKPTLRKENNGLACLEVDVNGRVSSAARGDRGKAFAGDTGSVYSIDLDRMVQVNSKTGYERNILRRVEQMTASNEDSSRSAGRKSHGSTGLDLSDGDNQTDIMDEDIPAFPADLIDPQTGELKEPLLQAKKGQLIQLQCKRDDGWAYGFVIYDTSVELNSNSPLVKAFQEIEKRKATAKETLNDSPSKGKGSRSENDSKKIGGSKKKRNGNIESDDDDDDDDDSVGVNSGWFPEAFTRAPNPLELASMQATLFSDDEDMNTKEQQVLDILAPPENWESKENPDPLNARLVNLKEGDKEFQSIVDFFKASLGNSTRNLKNIMSVRRIESLSLWQSFVAKRRQLETRAVAEGKDEEYAKAYEQVWMFHGTAPDVIPKICAQGFNRSFCGKNAVAYGKGVYFANNSFYSNRYAHADNKGVKRMFLCRVVVGEFCLGRNGQLTPDIRDKKRDLLYDATTDSMDSKKRDMYVVYHDAQAYPEYLLEYTMSS